MKSSASLFLFDPFQTLYPIPIGNGLNQPIYTYHVTHAGRKRVKAEIRNKNCWFIGGIMDIQFSLWNFLTFSLQPAIIGESLIIFSHLKLTETCHFISFSFSCRWKTCQSKLLTHVGGVNKNYFYLDTMWKHNLLRSIFILKVSKILNLKVFDIIIEYQVTMSSFQDPTSEHWVSAS